MIKMFIHAPESLRLNVPVRQCFVYYVQGSPFTSDDLETWSLQRSIHLTGDLPHARLCTHSAVSATSSLMSGSP